MRQIFTISLLFFIVFQTQGQKQLSIEDAVGNFTLTPDNIRNLQWIENDERFIYNEMVKGEDFLLSGHIKNTRIDTIAKASNLHLDLKRIPELNIIDKNTAWFAFKKVFYQFDFIQKKSIKMFEISEMAEHEDVSPNKKKVAYTIGNNLYIKDSDKKIAVAEDANKAIVYGQAVHRNEFGITKGTFWSPDANKLAFYRMDENKVTEYPLLLLDGFPGTTKMIRYPMAGQKSHHVTVGIFDLTTQRTVYLQTGEPQEQYLTNIAWNPNNNEIYIAVVNRDQNVMKLNAYSTTDGKFIRTVLTDKDEQWVEPEHPIVFIPGQKNRFIWQSERDGFNHLYVYDTNGKFHRQITKGNFVVTELHGFDRRASHVFVTITDNDGLDRKLLKVNIENGKSAIMTTESGTHQAKVNGWNGFFIDNFSAHDKPRRISIHQADGKLVKTLLEAKDPLAEYVSPRPELLKLNADDGSVLNARLFKPANFDPKKKYPVIVYVYGGPHAQMISNRWLWGANNWMIYIAAQGYVVFTLDNRGSAYRGKEFEQVIHRQLGTPECDDQMKGVEYLKKQSYVDAARIALHGWSYGGFMTASLMCRFPDVFKCGVAGGPVIDWKMYEIMYTERYMDHPDDNPEGYEQNSLLNQIKQLKGRLMLVHGTIDNVVLWQHSQELVKKAIAEGILLDYMIYPDHEHNVRGKDRIHLMKTVSRYLVEQLK